MLLCRSCFWFWRAPERAVNSALSDAREPLDIRIGRSCRQLSRQLRLVQPVPLGDQAGHAGADLVELVGDHLAIGAHLGLIQAHQQVACLHAHPVISRDLSNHAADRMLNLLHVGFDHQSARHRHRRRKRHDDGPPAREADAQDQHPEAGPKLELRSRAEDGRRDRDRFPGLGRVRRQPAFVRSGRRNPPKRADGRTLPCGSANPRSAAALRADFRRGRDSCGAPAAVSARSDSWPAGVQAGRSGSSRMLVIESAGAPPARSASGAFALPRLGRW